jgi:PleD family two-component response regulator
MAGHARAAAEAHAGPEDRILRLTIPLRLRGERASPLSLLIHVSTPQRILIVNDHDDDLLLLRHALEREFPGVQVLEFLDAEAALDALRKTVVDGVITDNRMPRLCGIEFVRQFRAWNATTPVVMLTGSEEMKAEAHEVGVTTFIASGSWGDIRDRIRRTFLIPPA